MKLLAYILYIVFCLAETTKCGEQKQDIFKELKLEKSKVSSIIIAAINNGKLEITQIGGKKINHSDLGWFILREGKRLVVIYNPPQISYNKDKSITLIEGETFPIIDKDQKSYIITDKFVDLEFALRELKSQLIK